MGKLICKKCHNVQNGSLEDKDLKCKRCGSNDLNGYFRLIKLYYRCQSCNKYFKISDISAKWILKHHQKVACPYCESKNTNPTLKRSYKKFSGQLQKTHLTQETNLFDYVKPLDQVIENDN